MENILIVDDELECQKLLALYLENKGYRVKCANSGMEALFLQTSQQIW